MYQSTILQRVIYPNYEGSSDRLLVCDWQSLRTQLLAQWERLSRSELETVGRDRHQIAALVQRKYGIPARLIENYLKNLERTLPVL